MYASSQNILNCTYSTTSCSSTGYETCLFKMYNVTNSHISDCSSAYNYSVCCSLDPILSLFIEILYPSPDTLLFTNTSFNMDATIQDNLLKIFKPEDNKYIIEIHNSSGHLW